MEANNVVPIRAEQQFLNTKEAAKYIGLSVKTLWNWSYTGKLIRHKVSNRNQYLRSDLDKFRRKIG